MNYRNLRHKKSYINSNNFIVFRKLLAMVTFLLLIASFTSLQATGTEIKANKINVAAKGAFLINSTTGKVIFEKNAHKRMYPASTTKILTALLAIEKGNLNDIVTVGKEVKLIKSDSSKAGLRPGERISLKDLIRGLMLPSGNDAANTIAVYIGRKSSKNKSLSINQSMNEFVDLMNKKAKVLGAKESHFMNAHGYHNSKHYTTVRDMTLIAKEAMKYKFFREVVKTENYTTKKIKNDRASYIHVWKNRNELLNKKSKNYYSYATGIKTGHTSQAGYCLVSSATKGKVKVIAVIMHSTSKDEWSDSKKLLGLGLRN